MAFGAGEVFINDFNITLNNPLWLWIFTAGQPTECATAIPGRSFHGKTWLYSLDLTIKKFGFLNFTLKNILYLYRKFTRISSVIRPIRKDWLFSLPKRA